MQDASRSPTACTRARRNRWWWAYLVVCGMDGLLTGIMFFPDFRFDRVNIAILYLIPVLIASGIFGLWPGVFAACLGLMSFDFFFVPPIFSYAVGDLRFLVSFAVFLVVAITTAGLASNMRRRAQEASHRARVAQTLFHMSRALTAEADEAGVIETVLAQIRDLLQTHAYLALVKLDGIHLYAPNGDAGDPVIDRHVLDWVLRHGNLVSFGSKSHRQAAFVYIPVRDKGEVFGALIVGEPGQFRLATHGEMLDILRATANLTAIAVSRIASQERAKLAEIAAESERLRTALMNSISHELRTPLTTMLGAADALADEAAVLDDTDRTELTRTIRDGALRMNRLVTNLIGMARIESGMMRLAKRPTDLADVVQSALREVTELTQHHPVHVKAPEHAPVVQVDEMFFQQALVNLISNAAKYSPKGTPIEISIFTEEGDAVISVRDYGVGIDEDEIERIFDKFYRSRKTNGVPGTGLGLAIVKAMVEAHGGTISIQRLNQGTAFIIRLAARDALKEEDRDVESRREDSRGRR
ncbi:ATP-binding protein [Alicyclobacillus hesperidum]|uniref:ATP-binding protein n=1 Tax=Alicyclobacillus hesperidum TaxID=89784 RepID=UPI000C1FAD06